MRGATGAVLGVVGLLAAAPSLAAQRPTISPRLAPAAADSTLTLWLFARPAAPLGPVRDAVVRLGGTVRHASAWLHAVSAEMPAAALEFLRARPDLRHIQPVAVLTRPRPAAPVPAVPGVSAARAAAPRAVDSAFGPSAMPLRRLNLFPLVERGFRGRGVRIALLDTGFETALPAFAGANVVAQRDFVFGDSVVRDEPGDLPGASAHGTEVWSLLAAEVPDTLIGIAPDADYLLAKVEDVRQEIRLEEDHYVAALEWADSVGVDVVNSSLAFLAFDGGFAYAFADLNGDVAVTTVAADAAAQRGIVLVTAMGNDGPASRTLATPADGDSVLGIGAEDSLGTLASFSSRGPTADGRLKPDFTAPGVALFVLTPQGGAQAFGRVSGTSFATPVVAGAAALLREIHPGIGAVGARTALTVGASNRAAPDTLRGWGRPDAFVSAVFPQGVTVVQPTLPAALRQITPRITWQAPGVPPFAGLPQYRLRVGRDTTLQAVLLDTVLTGTEVTLPPQRPAATFAFELTATAADSARVVLPPDQLFVVPPWVTLTTLNDPGGLTIRDPRPRFSWQAGEALPPFGPLTFDLQVTREDNGGVALAERGLTALSFVPEEDLEFNTPYRWQVTARLAGDSVVAESPGTFLIVRDDVPTVTTLFQNFPNPFPNAAIGQGTTCLWFDLATQGVVSLEILDVRGHVVRRLLPTPAIGPLFRPGRYGRPAGGGAGQCDPAFEWDGHAGDGTVVPAGLYLARLVTPDGSFFRRIVFLGPGP